MVTLGAKIKEIHIQPFDRIAILPGYSQRSSAMYASHRKQQHGVGYAPDHIIVRMGQVEGVQMIRIRIEEVHRIITENDLTGGLTGKHRSNWINPHTIRKIPVCLAARILGMTGPAVQPHLLWQAISSARVPNLPTARTLHRLYHWPGAKAHTRAAAILAFAANAVPSPVASKSILYSLECTEQSYSQR